MKKFCKIILGLAAFGAAVAGVLYFIKNVVMKDYLDDYDDDDFDNDPYDEDEERDYVTLTPEEEKEEEDELIVDEEELADTCEEVDEQ